MKVVFLGASGPLSFIPLRALIAAQCEITAVGVVSNEMGQVSPVAIPVVTEQQESIQTLAALHDIPIVKLSLNSVGHQRQLAAYSPDVILVSCFAQKLSDSVLNLPPSGCFNLHPSLLPKYRGPVPLYWQLRDGVRSSGITLHRMTSDLDAGPIVSQASIELRDRDSQHSLAQQLAKLGGELMVACLKDLENGALSEQLQDESAATYQGYP